MDWPALLNRMQTHGKVDTGTEGCIKMDDIVLLQYSSTISKSCGKTFPAALVEFHNSTCFEDIKEKWLFY